MRAFALIWSACVNTAVQQKLSTALPFVSLLLLGILTWWDRVFIVPVSIILYVLFALGASDRIRVGLRDARFWQSLVRKHGLIFVALSFLIAITNTVVYAIWALEATPDAFYFIWNKIDTPLHLLLPLSAMILGIVVGRHYSNQTGSAADSERQPQEIANALGELPQGWFYTLSARRLIWKGLAFIGIIPFLLSVTIVVGGKFYRSKGLFYTWLDGTHIGNVEWVSDSMLRYRVVNFVYSDCFGCGPTPFCDYEVDLSSGETNEISCQEIDRLSSPIAEGEPPQRIPTRDKPLLSPDGTRVAYVVKDYDLYVKPGSSVLFGAQRVYRYPASGFFGRYYWELAMALIYSLPVGILLVAAWAYVNKRYT